MAKTDRIASIAAAAKKAKAGDDAPVALKYKPSAGMGAKIGAHTGWNPELAKGGEVRTYTPAQKVDALLSEAKAARKKVAPKLVEPSGSKTPQLKSGFSVPSRMTPQMSTAGETARFRSSVAADSFIRSPAPAASAPNRAGTGFKAGSKADMAFTGVKPSGVSPRGPRQRTLTPPSVGSTPTTPAIHTPTARPKLPKARMGGKLFAVSAAINLGEAAYYEVKKRQRKGGK